MLTKKEKVLDKLNKDKTYMVLLGCDGTEREWLEGIEGLFHDEGLVDKDYKIKESFIFENLGRIDFIIDVSDIDISKLAIVRLKMREVFGAMWLQDYIDNEYYLLGGMKK